MIFIALSSIRAKDGHTPLEIVKDLLVYAEDACFDETEKSSSWGRYHYNSVDGTYLKSILLLSLSRIRLSRETERVDWWLKKISRVADTCLATNRLSNLVSSNRQTHVMDTISDHTSDVTLCAAALACLSEIDDQVGGGWSRNYIKYIDDLYPSLIRITALECYMRLCLTKCIVQRLSSECLSFLLFFILSMC